MFDNTGDIPFVKRYRNDVLSESVIMDKINTSVFVDSFTIVRYLLNFFFLSLLKNFHYSYNSIWVRQVRLLLKKHSVLGDMSSK